ncbi:MAG TPA: SGNH/GDSL hydrolase family protein [Candidatus Hydrogenedentes bacterium]|nr:SGNH/GDSL hydrolase family protein [Candidatus Hydrogenedentota bacterium]HPG66761.1 SGNH/GDSL hydrolase family protein [Candidatus Hydrogenedentota bacterium]
MRKLARTAFLLAVALFWIAATIGALEVFFAVKWRNIERRNPYVLARDGTVPWPDGSNAEFREDYLATAPAAGPQLATWTPLDEAGRRAAFFARLSEDDRATFAEMYLQDILVFDARGEAVQFYSLREEAADAGSLLAVYGDAVAHVLRDALAKGESALLDVPAGQGTRIITKLFVYPLAGEGREGEAAAAFLEHADTADPGHPMWEKPFFIYKKHAYREDQEFHTNNVGFRDDDVVLPKPEGVFRIVCIGGSTTEEGDANAVTYPNLLERKLKQRFDAPSIDVINCGLTGVNTLKEKMRLPDYLALEPDLIVYYNAVNDICHYHFPRWVADARLWQRVVRQSRFLNFYLNRWLLPDEARMMRDLDAVTFANLKFMHDYAAERGVDMAFCSFAHPDIEHLSSNERAYYDFYNDLEWGGRYVSFATYCRAIRLYNRLLVDCCKRNDFGYIPVAENIQGGGKYFGDVCHMKNAGIDLKASIVADYVAEYLQTLNRR